MTQLLTKKKKAIKLLTARLNEGDTILSKIPNIQNQAEYDTILDEHELWWNSTGTTLKEIFDKETIANEFQFVGFFVPTGTQSLVDKVLEFKGETNNDVNKIKTIIKDITNDLYKEKDGFEFTYDGIIAALKKNKVVAIILVLVVLFFGISKLIDEAIKTKKNVDEIVNDNKPQSKDLSINAAFMKKDSTFTDDLNENEIKTILGDNISIEQNGETKKIKLKFTLSDEQLSQYIGFRFNFGLDFYNQLGGDKFYPDGWLTSKLGTDNKLYSNEPGTFKRYLTFETTYNQPK